MKTKTKRPHWSAILEKFKACREAVKWARTQRSPKAAWNSCEEYDWMRWAVEHSCDCNSELLSKIEDKVWVICDNCLGVEKCKCSAKSAKVIRKLHPEPPKLVKR